MIRPMEIPPSVPNRIAQKTLLLTSYDRMSPYPPARNSPAAMKVE